ncbi:MAG: histidine phosphatase family protein, partial [Candidatus Thermoplasmatota archaeon]|nr:histidine phosphatase family protein [Candidatus Thermoplasmatota archaeon]MCL5787625.1 histidine phosphatase family protein [Candidatus Thermoplasmatota archaeon]
IYLVRHGETDWNNDGRFQGHVNIPLNEKGKIQAQEAYERLKAINFDLIYSSDLGRAAETARIINAHREIPIRYDQRLRERDAGKYSGLTLSEIAKIKGVDLTISKYVSDDILEGIEPLSQLISRVTEFIDHLMNSKFKRCLIIGHGGSLSIIASNLTGIPFKEMMFRNCGIKKVIMEDSNALLEEVI